MPKPINDSIIHAYVARRDLATIALNFQQTNDPCSSMSDLVRKVIQYFSILCVENWNAQEVESSEDATRILSELFPQVNLNPSKRGLPSYMKNLQKEELERPSLEIGATHQFLTQTEESQQMRKSDLERATKDALEQLGRS